MEFCRPGQAFLPIGKIPLDSGPFGLYLTDREELSAAMTENWDIRGAGDFGEAIRKARAKEHLTQRQLALSVGAGERFIVDLENGKETVRLGKALQVATALGIKITMTYET